MRLEIWLEVQFPLQVISYLLFLKLTQARVVLPSPLIFLGPSLDCPFLQEMKPGTSPATPVLTGCSRDKTWNGTEGCHMAAFVLLLALHFKL